MLGTFLSGHKNTNGTGLKFVYAHEIRARNGEHAKIIFQEKMQHERV
jgi:hypothetical protein